MYFVYIIRSGKKGCYKIGIARNVENRMASLQCGNPAELFLIAKFDFGTKVNAFRAEQRLHKIFRRHHVRGEWFDKRISLAKADALFKTDFEEQHGVWKEKIEREENDEILDLELLEVTNIYR